VHCVDSGTVFAGLALLALGAAEKALAGDGSNEVLRWLELAKSETATFMISPSMAMLARIGRVAELKADERAPAYALVEVRAGRLELVGTAESFAVASDQLLEYAVQQYKGLRPGRAVIDHGRVPGLADDLAWRVGGRWPQCQVTRMDDGPMTAVVADGAGGVAFAIGPKP
jgi:fatty acid-binding protein DegV